MKTRQYSAALSKLIEDNDFDVLVKYGYKPETAERILFDRKRGDMFAIQICSIVGI